MSGKSTLCWSDRLFPIIGAGAHYGELEYAQAWGRPAGTNAALDLVNFERYQAKLVFGVNF